MAQELVRVRLDGVDTNVSSAFAKAKGLDVLEESPRKPDGSLRGPTRANGRRVKPKTSVAKQAAAKKAAAKKAAAKQAAVIEPAPNEKEQDR